MFKVRDVGTGRVHTVYAVNGCLFLIFIDGELPRWEWRNMDHFEPVGEV